ncbi:MAG: glycosyltransferase family 39 protein [Candidatus Sumerlaeia bacterium]
MPVAQTPPIARRPLPPAAEAAWLSILFVAAAALLAAGAWRIGFQPGERVYAQVGREIAPGSALVVMHRLGNVYPDKPPVVFWMEAISFRLMGGSTPLAARLPVAVLALAGLGFAYLLMRRLEGARVALIGAAALLVSMRFAWQAKHLNLDLPMCAFLWGAFWASAKILFPPAGGRPAGAAWAWFAWTMLGLAVLANGLAALVWPAALILYALLTRRYDPLRRHLFWAGLAWAAAIVALWFVPAATMGGRDYYRPMFQFGLLERLCAFPGMDRPSWTFLDRIPLGALPMGLLLPAGLWCAWRERRRPGPARGLFVVCWLISGVAFLGVPIPDGDHSLLVIYPAIAILAARFIDAGFGARRPHRLLWFHALLACLIALVCVPALIALLIFKPALFPAAPPGRYVLGTLAALTFGGGAAGYLVKRRRLKASIAVLALVAWYGYILLFAYYMPVIYDDRLPRQVASGLNKRLAAGEAVGFMNTGTAASLYMTRDPHWLRSPGDVRIFMAHEDQRWLLTTAGGFSRLGNPGWPVREQWGEATGSEPLILVGNRVLSILPEVLYESPKK